jgi:amidase
MPDTAAADLLFRPVDELAGLVRDGTLGARELVQASLDRIDELNPQINAFVDVFDDEALAAADAIGPGDERPFAGVPIAIKNNRAVEGKRLTFASEFFGDFAAPYDHNVTRRLKAAGFIVVGTTTLPEFGILPVTETRRFGATRNPWDTGRTPGGSSGGSAAAVASAMVPIAHANDGGGSIRIPAACCGLVGLKPQRGRVSAAPEAGGLFLVADGVLTRTVRETAAVLDVLAGPELGDAWWAPEPDEPFAASAAREPGRLRIAMTTQSPLEAEGTAGEAGGLIDPVCARAVHDAADLLRSLGHEVVEDAPPWAAPGILELFTASFGPAICTQIAFASLIAGREPTADDMEPLSWAIWELCAGITSTQALAAELQLQGFGRALVTWTAQYDGLLMPALAEAPVTLGTIDPMAEHPMSSFSRSGTFTPFTAMSNISGSPAISLPLYERGAEDGAPGVPLAVQIVGQPAGEAALLALSAQLEAAHPWADRRPSLG